MPTQWRVWASPTTSTQRQHQCCKINIGEKDRGPDSETRRRSRIELSLGAKFSWQKTTADEWGDFRGFQSGMNGGC